MASNDALHPVFELITEAHNLRALKPEWDDLWRRTNAPASQSCDYALLAWDTVVRPSGARLHCLAGRVNGRLVALWPLVMERRAQLWRALRPLELISTEPSDILVEPGAQAASHVTAAWRALRALSRADLLWLSFVADGSLLQAAVAGGGGQTPILMRKPNTNWVVSWTDGESWDGWYNRLSSSYRRAQKKKQAILNRLGETRFEVLEDPARCGAAVDALLAWKREWAAQFKTDPGGWLFEARYEDFLRCYFTTPSISAQPRVCALTLNGAPVAVLLVTAGPRRIDALIASFDPRHAQASPGIALYEHCLRWAHASGRDIDFGPGQELNKRYWCHDRPRPVTSYSIALTPWGVMASRSLHLARKLAWRLRAKRQGVGSDASAG